MFDFICCQTRVKTSQFHIHISTSLPGGKLRGPMGKLPEFPGTFLLGMRLPSHGYHVHGRLWRRLRQNHPGPPVYGLLHPWWFGKNTFVTYCTFKILHGTNHNTTSSVSKCLDSAQEAFHLLCTLMLFLWLIPPPQYVACHVLFTVLQLLFRMLQYVSFMTFLFCYDNN